MQVCLTDIDVYPRHMMGDDYLHYNVQGAADFVYRPLANLDVPRIRLP